MREGAGRHSRSTKYGTTHLRRRGWSRAGAGCNPPRWRSTTDIIFRRPAEGQGGAQLMGGEASTNLPQLAGSASGRTAPAVAFWCARQDLNLRPTGSKGIERFHSPQVSPTNSKIRINQPFTKAVELTQIPFCSFWGFWDSVHGQNTDNFAFHFPYKKYSSTIAETMRIKITSRFLLCSWRSLAA